MANLRFQVNNEDGSPLQGCNISLGGYSLETTETENRMWFITRGWVNVKSVSYELAYEATVTKDGYRPVVRIVKTKPVIVRAGFTIEQSGLWVPYTTHGLSQYAFAGGDAITSSSGVAVIDIGTPNVSGRNEGYWGFNPYVPYLPWISYFTTSPQNFIIEENLFTLTIVPLVARTKGPSDFLIEDSVDDGGLYSWGGILTITVTKPDGTTSSDTTGYSVHASNPVGPNQKYPFALDEYNSVSFSVPPGTCKYNIVADDIDSNFMTRFEQTPGEVVVLSDTTIFPKAYLNDLGFFRTKVSAGGAGVNGVTITNYAGDTTVTAAGSGDGFGAIPIGPPQKYLPVLGEPPADYPTADEQAYINRTHQLTFSKSGYETVVIDVVSDGNGIYPNTFGAEQEVVIRPVYDITFQCRKQGDSTYVAAYPATLTVDGVDYATPSSGLVVVPLVAGNHTYSLAQSGCDGSGSQTINVTTTANQPVYSYEPMTITFNVTSGGTPVDGAAITIGSDTYTTNASGICTDFKKLAGTYTYVIHATDKASVTDTVTLNKAPVTENVSLAVGYNVDFIVSGGTGALVGAVVTMNGISVLTGHPTGDARIGVPNGTYSYAITKQYFEDYTGSVTVSGADPANISITMTGKDLGVLFRVMDDNTPSAPVEGATVTYRSTSIDTDVNGLALFTKGYDLVARAYTVVKGGFTTASGTVATSAPKTVNVQLAWDRYSLEVHVTKPNGDDLSDATVTLQTGESLTTNALGIANFSSVHGGTWTVTTSRAAYQTDTSTVVVDGANETLEVALAYATTSILKSPCGLQMMDWVAPIYDNSTVAQSMFEAQGAAWCEVKGWVADLINSRFVVDATTDYPTTEWGIRFWEEMCALPHGASSALAQRRRDLAATMDSWGEMDTQRFVNAVARALNQTVYVKEYTGSNTFTLFIPNAYEPEKLAEIMRRKKPAHLSYVVSATTPSAGNYDCVSNI